MKDQILVILERPAAALFASTISVGTSLFGGVLQKIDPLVSSITILAACITAVCIAILHVQKVWISSRRLMRHRRRTARRHRPP